MRPLCANRIIDKAALRFDLLAGSSKPDTLFVPTESTMTPSQSQSAAPHIEVVRPAWRAGEGRQQQPPHLLRHQPLQHLLRHTLQPTNQPTNQPTQCYEYEYSKHAGTGTGPHCHTSRQVRTISGLPQEMVPGATEDLR